ncbi:glycosyltransferase [Megasphaera sp. DISK 18]|uniref:glycosyltransferase n=1 Tax=Megasphaera sp. DISK 18 TaxID=1776081 RepID=UPI000806F4C6|nr:glycosyltransferase [Megasphaera sp. DISK 18]OBZ33316.1 glycosyltransferase [Megasphaera sp. DISK 18]
MKLAGVVTLYHPNENVMSNIASFLEELDVLYVLDNTENPDESVRALFSRNDKIRYKAFGDNMGIAFAMNYALKEASDFDFLLTMDQDSYFFPGMMKKYRESIESMEAAQSQRVGVYSVNFDQRIDPVVPGHKKIKVAITSGSVIPIKIAIKIGGFDENLFIDEVDNEFCYRARENGYDIIEFPSILLKHSLGRQTFHQILGFHYNTFNHNAIRKYYMTRNRIYVMKRYPEVKNLYVKIIIKDIVKVILSEDDKIRKIKYIIKGGKDGLMGRIGKLLDSKT